MSRRKTTPRRRTSPASLDRVLDDADRLLDEAAAFNQRLRDGFAAVESESARIVKRWDVIRERLRSVGN